ncbi:Sporulation related domain-containing protein [Ruegeria intermedia]|uniref:Sporulation related domain-containing protein n=2 Tax=Ruegeria intermedia TaxID=996115 RepID=A0A1M5A1U1_9RHOB|nr:SPOR domain-containing protein [Ruegeria intermedia]SHF24258.1 Sporulation related domain-containing protein [Ruegeria intermedia]
METATQTRFGRWTASGVIVALMVLSGCDEALLAGGQSSKPKPDGQQNGGATELLPEIAASSQRDVEAPDVFQVTEAGLWDGRPSLGGVWVAHPDVAQPERVKITNTANDKSVSGALFRRERNLPGPALQVSSAAAEKLGMLAGAPTRLTVVALRREAVEPPAPEAEPAGDVAADATVSATTGETPDKTDAEATTATEDKPAKRKWWQKKEPDETAATGAAAGVAAGAAAVAATAPQQTTADSGATATLADPVVTPPAEKPAKRKWWQKKPKDEITQTPLDPISGAAAAIEASDPTPAKAETAPTGSNLTKPFVQIGTFSEEGNAKAAADKVSKNGLSAQVQQVTSGDKQVWRVLVGPAATRAERRAILSDMKDLGFSDAFIAAK